MYCDDGDLDLDLDNVRIGEIDLAALGRSYMIMKRYFDIVNSEISDSFRATFASYLFSKGLYFVERQLAFRMVFESLLAAPMYEKSLEKVLKQYSIDDEDEKN